MQNFFRRSTPFQQDVEKVTDANQPNENWSLIMKICDHVAIHEEGYYYIECLSKAVKFSFFLSAKEAMTVIRKRLQTNPTTSGWRTIGLTLTVC